MPTSPAMSPAQRSQPQSLLDELAWRGLLFQATDEAALRKHLEAAPRRLYVGFDPTADSLTIGNLVPIMLLVHARRAGHTPVVVMGGGTGLIGDPSGKSAERGLLSRDQVEANVASQRRIFDALLDRAGGPAPVILNNLDWLAPLSFIEILRDVGKHFSVNEMVKRDSIRDRLETREQGISYTEFSYMILQAYDYLHLFREQQVSIQMGGSDQWGNIVSGVDLIRRVEQGDSFGLTAPLVTKSDGGKFGKTEAGAIWLTKERTSPYAYFQFWLNADDADVIRYLKIFTLLPRDEIERLEGEHAANPGQRTAHRALAHHATALLHGEAASERAEHAARALFTGDVARLDEESINEVFAETPSSRHSMSDLEGDGLPLVELLPQTTLAKSKREARELLGAGSITINGRKAAPEETLKPDDLLHGSIALLRRGKKTWHATRWGR